jgi:hypothetical protein
MVSQKSVDLAQWSIQKQVECPSPTQNEVIPPYNNISFDQF